MSIHSKGRQFFTNFPTMSHVIAATTSLNDRTTGASLGIFWKPLVSFLDGSTWQAGFQAEAPNTQQPVFLLGWSGHLFVDYQNSMAIKVCICNVYIKYIYIYGFLQLTSAVLNLLFFTDSMEGSLLGNLQAPKGASRKSKPPNPKRNLCR